jgi:hypothetical protein
MVYLKVDEGFSDPSFGHLSIFLKIIDRELQDIQLKISCSPCPDSEGLFDLGEYLIGYGFVAIQRYVTETKPARGKLEGNIYEYGFKLHDELFLIEAINAGANYWKHELEWPFRLEFGDPNEEGLSKISINRDGDYFSGMQRRTFDIVSKLTSYADYTLSSLLAEINERTSRSSSLFFEPLLPYVAQWRDELDHALDRAAG